MTENVNVTSVTGLNPGNIVGTIIWLIFERFLNDWEDQVLTVGNPISNGAVHVRQSSDMPMPESILTLERRRSRNQN